MIKRVFKLFQIARKLSTSGAIDTINQVHQIPVSINLFFSLISIGSKNNHLANIKLAQKYATQTIFKRKKIPFRSFDLLDRSESSLGEMFTFFMLETILIGEALNLDPFNQPAVELIKIETKKILNS